MRIARALLLSLVAAATAVSATARPLMDVTPRETALIAATEILEASAASFSFAGYDGDAAWRLDAAHVGYTLNDTPQGLALSETLELRLTQKFEDHVEPHLSLRRFDYAIASGAALIVEVSGAGEDLGSLVPFEVSTLELRCAEPCFVRTGRERQGRATAADASMAWTVDKSHDDAVRDVAFLLAVSQEEAARLGEMIRELAKGAAAE